MKYTRYYQLEYEYYIITPTKPPVRTHRTCRFETELERNKCALELFARNKEGQIVLISLKETDVRLWEAVK